MVKTKLTKKQVTAVLAAIYFELEVLLSEFDNFKKITDDPPRRKRILEDLSYLIQETLQHDLKDRSLFKMFDH